MHIFNELFMQGGVFFICSKLNFIFTSFISFCKCNKLRVPPPYNCINFSYPRLDPNINYILKKNFF